MIAMQLKSAIIQSSKLNSQQQQSIKNISSILIDCNLLLRIELQQTAICTTNSYSSNRMIELHTIAASCTKQTLSHYFLRKSKTLIELVML
jgi:hypothetical protein